MKKSITLSLDVLLQGKKNPNVIYNDESYTNLDFAEINLAKETTKYFNRQKMYITKDEDGRWMKWLDHKPELVIPINEKNPMYYEAKGEFESISEAEALKILSKIPIMVEIN